MDSQTLSLLERAVEPYRSAGFVIISQSEGAIVLSPPSAKFSYLIFFVALVLFWPAAVIYLIYFNSRRNKQVCVRVTSQGQIEETGYTIEAMQQERRQGRLLLLLLFIGIPVLLVLVLLLLGYRPR